MGFSEWRATGHMKNPVRGIFKVTGFYDVRSCTKITGVITAPGIPATPAEHKTDKRGRWAGNEELPMAVDQADPSKFLILWDEVDAVSWQSQELRSAQLLADQINAGRGRTPGAGFTGFDGAGFDCSGFSGSGFGYTTTVTIGPDGQPMSAEAAAQISEVIRETIDGISAAFVGAQGAFFVQPGAGEPPYGGFNPAQAAHMIDSQTGESGTAVVLDVQEAPNPPGFPLPPGGKADLLLEVTRADGTVYQTRTVIAFRSRERRAAIATPGTHLHVRIDPSDPARVAVDPTRVF